MPTLTLDSEELEYLLDVVWNDNPLSDDADPLAPFVFEHLFNIWITVRRTSVRPVKQSCPTSGS